MRCRAPRHHEGENFSEQFIGSVKIGSPRVLGQSGNGAESTLKFQRLIAQASTFIVTTHVALPVEQPLIYLFCKLNGFL